MSTIRNRFSPEVRTRAVRMVLEHIDEYSSRWAAITSISAKIGCVAQTLNDWVKRNEVDGGMRAGVSTDCPIHLLCPDYGTKWSEQALGPDRRDTALRPSGSRP